MISTSRKINAILLNIYINWPKLVSTCGYKLATKVAKVYGNILSRSKNIAKRFGQEVLYWLTLYIRVVIMTGVTRVNPQTYRYTDSCWPAILLAQPADLTIGAYQSHSLPIPFWSSSSFFLHPRVRSHIVVIRQHSSFTIDSRYLLTLWG